MNTKKEGHYYEEERRWFYVKKEDMQSNSRGYGCHITYAG
jgi:hypothetical protein